MNDDFKIWYDAIDWETASQFFEVPFSEPFDGYNLFLARRILSAPAPAPAPALSPKQGFLF